MADFSLKPAYGYSECSAPKWAKWVPISDAVKPDAPKQSKEWIGG